MRFRGGGIGHATVEQPPTAQQDAPQPDTAELPDAGDDAPAQVESDESAVNGEQDGQGDDSEDGDNDEEVEQEDEDELLFPDSDSDPDAEPNDEDEEGLAMEDDGDDLDYFD